MSVYGRFTTNTKTLCATQYIPGDASGSCTADESAVDERKAVLHEDHDITIDLQEPNE